MKFSIVAAALLGSALLSYAAPIDLNERFVDLKVFFRLFVDLGSPPLGPWIASTLRISPFGSFTTSSTLRRARLVSYICSVNT